MSGRERIFFKSVLTKVAATVGQKGLGPLLVVLLVEVLLRLMVPIIAEAILRRGILVGVVLMLVLVLKVVVLLEVLLLLLLLMVVGGHGVVHITTAIQIGIRVAWGWWSWHYTAAYPRAYNPTANSYSYSSASSTSVSAAVGQLLLLLLNGGQCGIATKIVTMPFAGKAR